MPKHIRKKFERGAPLGRLRLTDADFALLKVVSDFRFANTPQLTAVCGRGSRNFKRRLSDLYQAGYLERPKQQINSRMLSGHLIYSLGEKGVDCLYLNTAERKDKYRLAKLNQQTTLPYITHALMISQFRAVLTLALRSYPTDPQLVRWVQGYELKDMLTNNGDKTELVPDAFFTILEKGDKLNFFLEADRGTMTQGKFFDKMKIYWQWHRENRCQKTLGINRFRVLSIAPTEGRTENLRKTTKEADPRKEGSLMYLFLCENKYSLEKPETILSPVWLSPKDDTPHSIVE